jgi:hypothetical protein
MSTPEGKVKDKIKKLLSEYKIYPASKAGDFPVDSAGWYFMPIATRFGVTGIPDFLGHYNGRLWAIEAKAKGKKPTGFQALQIEALRISGAPCFIVDGPESLEEFKQWLVK